MLRAVVVAAASSSLAVASAADPNAAATPLLLRAIANSVALRDDPRLAEVLPIPEQQLRAWARPPGAAPSPRVETFDEDDRRWMWGFVLLLIAAEAWMRRPRNAAAGMADEESARVA